VSVLVTGAGGFVGAHVVDRLVEAGLGPVVAADLAPPDAPPSPSVAPIALDVTDLAAVRAALAAWRPDFIVHAAAITPSVDDEAEDAARIMAVNVGGAANVAAAALAHGVRRLVLFSSSGVYNGLAAYPERLEESTPLPQAPTSLYAASKIAAEGLAHRLAATGRLSICAVRVSSVYGERERPTGSRGAARMSLMHRMAQAAAARSPVRIEGGAARREWVHGDDVGRAVAALLQAARLRHVVYNLGFGVSTPFADLVPLFAAEGLRVADHPDAPVLRMTDAEDRPPLDLARIAEDAAYQPRTSLADGVAALVAFHRRAPPSGASPESGR